MSLWIKRGTRGTASRAGSPASGQNRPEIIKKEMNYMTFQTVGPERATPPAGHVPRVPRLSRVSPPTISTPTIPTDQEPTT